MERATQLRTIKHDVESKFKKRIEVDSVLFSWLIPYITDTMNKYKIGTDRRTAYERIIGHKCRHFVLGFAETVDYILETEKGKQFKADSRVGVGVSLGYAWRTTEYLVGTKDGIYGAGPSRGGPRRFLTTPAASTFSRSATTSTS